MNISLDIPVNSVSFGQVSYNLLRKLFERGEEVCLFPKGGNVDLSSFSEVEGFIPWLNKCVERAFLKHRKNQPAFKLWHINGSMESYSAQQYLYTFHETNRLTNAEINALACQEKVLVSSTYTKSVFESHGVENVIYAPIGFDSYHFTKVSEPKRPDGIIFGLRGKLEKRKHTLKILKIWADTYGDNWDYRLDCSIFNPFLDPKGQDALIRQALGGKVPANINFLPSFKKNVDYNQCLNSVDIDLTGMSGCEGFNLPCFQSLCLGKWAVVLNAHVHKDYANSDNSILVEPKAEMVDAEDGVFFKKNQPFNQGKWFDFEAEDLVAAMKKAESKAGTPNPNGEALSKQFSYDKTLDTILGEMI